jgi:hypothetical protein
MDALQCYDSSSGSDTDDVNKEGDLRRKRLKPAPTASGKVLPSSSVLLPPPPLEFFSPLPNPRKAFRYVDRSWSLTLSMTVSSLSLDVTWRKKEEGIL